MTKLNYRDAEQISGCQGEQWWGTGSGCDRKRKLKDDLCSDGIAPDLEGGDGDG